MEAQLVDSKNSIDKLEATMESNFQKIECPLRHIFTPGLYTREIFMPAGSLITSKIHNSEHPFIVSQGVVTVFADGQDAVIIEAPYMGITKPGTRRVLLVHEDTIWTTFHVNPGNTEDLAEIEATIMQPHINPLLKKNSPCLETS